MFSLACIRSMISTKSLAQPRTTGNMRNMNQSNAIPVKTHTVNACVVEYSEYILYFTFVQSGPFVTRFSHIPTI